MAWVKLDDGIFRHPKMRRAGKDGRLLFLSGLTYCAANLTDGLIPDEALPVVAVEVDVKPTVARRLVEVHLWHRPGEECPECPPTPPGHLRVHDYLEWNDPAERVKAKRRARAEAGRLGGERSGAIRRSNGEANASPAVRSKPEANPKLPGSQSVEPRPVQSLRDNPPLGSPPFDDQRSEPEANASPRKRAVAPPETLAVSDEMRRWASDQHIHVDLEAETAKLLDWARSKGESRRDWLATWRNWMRRAQEDQARRAPTPSADQKLVEFSGHGGPPADPERNAERARTLRREQAG